MFDFKKLTKQEIADILKRCHFTKKERLFFGFRCDGLTLEEIAEKMKFSSRTADNFSRSIKAKIE